jgi:hypothetical protein
VRKLLTIVLFWLIGISLVAAQRDTFAACARSRQADAVSVLGYAFRAYEEPDLKDDLGCLQIFYKGKVVYRLSTADKYSLGQQGDKEFKIPGVSAGSDLTGDGRPDVIVTSWSGGSHCCYTKYVFELEPKLRLIATIRDGDTDIGHFEKLERDATYHYLTYDIWSYWPASFAGSVTHKVLLKWNGTKFKLDLDRMRFSPPTPEQWNAALKDVDDAVADGGEARDALGETLWDTTLDLIYTGHSDLAWKFVREANPNALKGDNPSLAEFCSRLKASVYWADLEPTLKDVPEECRNAKRGTRE